VFWTQDVVNRPIAAAVASAAVTSVRPSLMTSSASVLN